MSRFWIETIRLGWLYERDSWVIVAVLLGAMMLAAEIGYQVGQRWPMRAGDISGRYFIAVQGSLLGLLALLLGFTFNMSTQRYEMRRQLVMDDANALGILWLQSSLLPEPQRSRFDPLLRQYIEVRADTAVLKHELTRAELANRIELAASLHGRMWEVVKTEVQGEHPARGAQAMVALLGDAQSLHRQRIYAYGSRVPEIIIMMLSGTAMTAMFAVGYCGGLTRQRGTLLRIMIAFVVCGTVFTILDLDTPRRGQIRVEQTPMLWVKQMTEHVSEPSP
jgi:hypothetical protein